MNIFNSMNMQFELNPLTILLIFNLLIQNVFPIKICSNLTSFSMNIFFEKIKKITFTKKTHQEINFVINKINQNYDYL